MMSNRGPLRAAPGPGRFVSRHECRFVSRLPTGEVGVVRQVVDQLADHETVVELGRHGHVTSAALPRVGPGQRRGSSVYSKNCWRTWFKYIANSFASPTGEDRRIPPG
jgi:hypothetical protein